MAREQAIQTLRDILAKVDYQSSDEMSCIAAEIRDAKASVLEKYQPIFNMDNLDALTAEEFRSFLLFRNNKHWDSMHRQGGRLTADMQKLRESLKILLNDELDIRTRLNRLRPPTGDPMVKGLGRAVITAILQVAYPDRYGVWNNTTKNGMKHLGIWPNIPRGASFCERYIMVNQVLQEIAEQIGIDLWTLDMLWWRVDPHMLRGRDTDNVEGATDPEEELKRQLPNGVFGLEKYLQEFLVDNWQNVELLRDWDLLEEDGEIVGSNFKTQEIGEVDLLAKRRDGSAWLVIELKRDQTSDATVGQLLRYMGWVRRNLAKGGDVQGLIVCRDINKQLQYALDEQSNIECMTYEVSFNLNNVPRLEQA